MKDDKFNLEEAPFNMAMLFYFNLNKLIEKKDEAYLNNDLEGWFKGLNRVYNKIVFKLNPAEEERVNKLFSGARYEIMNRPVSEKVSFILHNIDFNLVKLMNKYKMIFPKIEVSKGLERVKKKYGLGDS